MPLKHWFHTFPLRLRSLLRRNRVEQDLTEELQFHLDQKTQEYVVGGLSSDEARRKARREFGGLEQAKENCRDTRRVNYIQDLVQDLRFGLRMLRKSPGFTFIAVLTLALGIGTNTAIFSMVNSFLLRPLPVKDPEQITTLAFQLKKGPLQVNFSIPELEDLRAQTTSVFSDVIGDLFGAGGLTVNGKTEPIYVYFVTGNYFTALDIKPHLGRFILPSEGSPTALSPVIVLGYNCWKTRFAGDPSVVGKTVAFDGHPVTVIGVAPKEFHGLLSMADIQGYMPLSMEQVDSAYEKDTPVNRELRSVFVYARLLPGVHIKAAQSSLDVIASRLAAQNPKSEEGMTLGVYAERFSRPNPDPDRTILKIATLFLILAGLVLILACVNVANFLLVRATARQREMAIRTALGGTRGRLVRQLLTESIVLALCGGIGGVLFGLAGSRALSSIRLHTTLPVLIDFQFDWRVFGYALGVALLTGLIVGTVPALRASGRNIIEVIREGGRSMSGGRSRLRSALVIIQVGGSLMLLIVAGLMVRSLSYAQRSDLGFDPRNVLNLTLDPNGIGYDKSKGLRFYKELLERIDTLPGVESSSVAFMVPFGYFNDSDFVEVPGYEVPQGTSVPSAGFNVISPGYFRTLRISLLEGRGFSNADQEDMQWVAIVNEAMAKRFWPKESALGHEFRIAGDRVHSLRVVGVVKNSKTNSMIGVVREYFYVPFAQQYSSLATVQVRTTFPPETLVTSIREQVIALAPTMPISEVRPMLQALYTVNGLLLFQFAAGLTGCLGLLGLILALVGVFGVISFAVSQRTQEIGIRMAMGAGQSSILKMILRQGILIIFAGLAAGVVLALGMASLVGDFVSGVSPYDPLTYFSVSTMLVLVALVACYVPARRATRVDPMIALRYE
jgi:predicted permease